MANFLAIIFASADRADEADEADEAEETDETDETDEADKADETFLRGATMTGTAWAPIEYLYMRSSVLSAGFSCEGATTGFGFSLLSHFFETFCFSGTATGEVKDLAEGIFGILGMPPRLPTLGPYL